MKQRILHIVLDTPLDLAFDYRWNPDTVGQALPLVGQLALVPFGRREVVGVVVGLAQQSSVASGKLKEVLTLRTQLAPLSANWIALCQFAAEYYQRPLGEVMLPGLPKNLRIAKPVALDRALKKAEQLAPQVTGLVTDRTSVISTSAVTSTLNRAQLHAVEAIASAHGFAPTLLNGITGSGKTEVYLQAAARILALAAAQQQAAQILILVPEINLTPQLLGSVQARFPDLLVATLHSSLAEGERSLHWVAAHLGQAQIVLGTRLAVLASLPHLKLIVIDEEHDPSYKQQEGLRYSARDLAVWRAHQLQIPVVLGSATPSLESWQHAQTGRYRLLELPQRAVPEAVLPTVRLIDMERERAKAAASAGISEPLAAALRLRLTCGEQALLFLNRRGYAPVLACDACGWVSNCRRCSAFMVLHKPERRLRCHHCSMELPIPRSCPTCGNVDLQSLGQGTQRLEEGLQQLFPEARLLRIDADSTRKKGSAQAAFEQVHSGAVDILIGTQMVAKGHDFKNLTLVGVLNPDTALFSHDYRASERLFAQLMQVAGRAGRAAPKEGGNLSEVLVQTRYPQHPLYAALVAHDYQHFAQALLAERRAAALPPYIYQALLRAEARELQTALDFLQQAKDQAGALAGAAGVTINDPIPMTITRVANMDRAQLLLEATSRPALQAFLKSWMTALRATKTRVRWSLEVDPVDI